MEALSLKFVQNMGFPLKIAWKLHDFEEILGARGAGVPWNIGIGKYQNNSHFSQGNMGTAVQQKEENACHNI